MATVHDDMQVAGELPSRNTTAVELIPRKTTSSSCVVEIAPNSAPMPTFTDLASIAENPRDSETIWEQIGIPRLASQSSAAAAVPVDVHQGQKGVIGTTSDSSLAFSNPSAIPVYTNAPGKVSSTSTASTSTSIPATIAKKSSSEHISLKKKDVVSPAEKKSSSTTACNNAPVATSPAPNLASSIEENVKQDDCLFAVLFLVCIVTFLVGFGFLLGMAVFDDPYNSARMLELESGKAMITSLQHQLKQCVDPIMITSLQHQLKQCVDPILVTTLQDNLQAAIGNSINWGLIAFWSITLIVICIIVIICDYCEINHQKSLLATMTENKIANSNSVELARQHVLHLLKKSIGTNHYSKVLSGDKFLKWKNTLSSGDIKTKIRDIESLGKRLPEFLYLGFDSSDHSSAQLLSMITTKEHYLEIDALILLSHAIAQMQNDELISFKL